jgi:cytochrome P450 family 3 subfamily A
MKYMDMVIDETLRLFPPATRTDRVANADFEYQGIQMKKGQVVGIPIYALHHDPDIYSSPEEFQPERFSDENKKKRDNEAYMPFGAGPRNCVGMRFALMEIKLMLSTVLTKYRFETCDKTPV